MRVCSSHETVLSTRRHPAHPVSFLILHPGEIQALWSQNYDAGSYVVRGRQQCYNAMPLCWAVTGATYIRQLPRCTEREKKERQKENTMASWDYRDLEGNRTWCVSQTYPHTSAKKHSENALLIERPPPQHYYYFLSCDQDIWCK